MPCSDSARTTAAGDIRLDFEVRALTVWATTLRYYVPAWVAASWRALLLSIGAPEMQRQNETVLRTRDFGREPRIGPGLTDQVHGGGVERSNAARLEQPDID